MAGEPTLRGSFDHDHVLTGRYAEGRRGGRGQRRLGHQCPASAPPLTLLGTLDGIEAGLRQLRRTRPLEVEEHQLPDGRRLRVPTLGEMLRIKAYLIVQRNMVRDYLDTVALTDRLGLYPAADLLTGIDEYYADRSGEADSVLTSLVAKLSQPSPRDVTVTRQLDRYRGLDRRWQEWPTVVAACHQLADGIVARLKDAAGWTLHLRNVDVDPDEPLESWPYKAVVTLIERGGVRELARLTKAIGADPWGALARQVEEYLSYASPAGIGPLLTRRIERARTDAEAAERVAVAGEVAELIGRSGLTLSEFATRIGTSRSRLSTYRSGSVTPRPR